MNFSYTKKNIDKNTAKYNLFENSQPLTWSSFLDLIRQVNVKFLDFFRSTLFGFTITNFFWECPPLSKDTLNNNFEMVLTVNMKGLSSPSFDIHTFADYFTKNQKLPSNLRNNYWVSFSNLKKDCLLICPIPYFLDKKGKKVPHFLENNGQILQCVNLRDFLDYAPQELFYNFWQGVAKNLLEEVNKTSESRWLSTHGLGVGYLHIRIDTKPKYYSHQEYKNPNFYSDSNTQNNNSDQREKEILQNDITNLENKPNKTAEEEVELVKKKDKLTKLEKNIQQNINDNPWLKPALIICGGLLIIGVVIMILVRKYQKNK